MAILNGKGNWLAAIAVAIALGLPSVHGASVYMSVAAETFTPDAAKYVATPGNAVTYVAVDGGYVESGDPVGGVTPPPAGLVSAALNQALAQSGYQPAPAGTTPTLLIVYTWGEIRRDSIRPQPINHLKGNDRTRLMLVDRIANAERIERSLVDDRYSPVKAGRMSLTANDREALQLAADDMHFIVVSAYSVAGLQQRQLVWQTRMTTRAVGHTMADALTTLIANGAPYFGHDEKYRVDLKKDEVPASSVRVSTPAAPAPAQLPAGVDSAAVQGIVTTEHDRWSGNLPND
jgi:hypothetical protein